METIWHEKVKMTQLIINEVKDLSDTQLDFKAPEGGWTIRKNVIHIYLGDSLLKLAFPISNFFSYIIPFKKIENSDIDSEMNRNTRVYNTPNLPARLEEIHINSASEISTESKRSLSQKLGLEEWKALHIQMEEYFSAFKPEDIFKKRILTYSGFLSAPAALDQTIMHANHHFHAGVLRCKNHKDFPKS